MLDLKYEVKSWDSSGNETVVYVSDPSSDPVLQSGWVHEDPGANRATTNSERRLDRPVQVTCLSCISQKHHKPIGINNLYNLSRLMLLWWETQPRTFRNKRLKLPGNCAYNKCLYVAFRRFFRSPNFDGWYRLRHREMTQKVECLHLEAVCAAVSMILDLDLVSAYITILLIISSECVCK